MPLDRHRIIRFVLVALAVACSSHLRGQGIVTTVNPEMVYESIAGNPDFDIASLWRSLRIPAALDTVYAKVGAPPLEPRNPAFDRCANTCLAQIARANIDADPAQEVILTIYQEWKIYRMLVFKGTPAATGAMTWRFLGHADHDSLGSHEPEWRVSFVGGRPYFVTSVPGTHGTGIWVNYDRWYEAGASGLREVLTVPTNGVDCGDARSLCRSFDATVVASKATARDESLVATFNVRYWGDEFLLDEQKNGQLPLFTRNLTAAFARPLKSAERYVLSPLDSSLASWELSTVFLPDALTCQVFLSSNSAELEKAVASESPARTWLARYVSGCTPSEERTAFLDKLK